MNKLPALKAVDEQGNEVDRSVMEDVGIAYAPEQQHLDLSKDEKLRTTALMMAIQAYGNLIIKDADMYIAMKNEERRGDGPIIKPGTIDAMVEAALKFELFIAGAYSILPAKSDEPEESEVSNPEEQNEDQTV